MITDRIDPPALLKIPEIVNITIATGTRSSTSPVKRRWTPKAKWSAPPTSSSLVMRSRTSKTRLEAAAATLGDVAKFGEHLRRRLQLAGALEALMSAAKEVFGDRYPLTANTLVGVASLWLPELLVEVDAIAIL